MESFLKRFLGWTRGSLKDPLFCLGLAAVFLFAFTCLFSGNLSKSLCKEGNFTLASLANTLREPVGEEIFAGLAQKTWSESPEFLLLSGNSLIAVTPPSSFSPQILGALVGGIEITEAKNTITEYIVEPGDSLWSVADKFDISLNTIIWANDLSQNSLLQPGQKLVILPASGILHYVKEKDTVSEIAARYKGKTEKIIAFNNLSGEGDIYVGDILIIPDGEKPKQSYQYAPSSAPLADSYFICPIAPPCTITQGLHWYNAIDFSHGKCGEVIYAAAAGEVLKVKLTNSTYKWAFNGYGNHMTILHPNGVVTYYGHISIALVSVGDKVSQGQPIALMGGKPGTPGAGHSTGCHVHFGVSGARNPFAR